MFRSLHPSPSAGDGLPIPKAKYSYPTDRPDNHRRCAMCGFQFDDDSNQQGDTLFSPGIAYNTTSVPGLVTPPVNMDQLGLNLNFNNFPYGTSFTNYLGTALSGRVFNDWNIILNGTPPFTNPNGITVQQDTIFNRNCLVISFSNGSGAQLAQIQQTTQLFGGLGIDYSSAALTQLQFSCDIVSSWATAVPIFCQLSVFPSIPQNVVVSPNLSNDGTSFQTLTTSPVLLIPSIPTLVTATIQIGNGSIPSGANFGVDNCHFYSLGSVQNVTEPNVVGGCPFCGSFNPSGQLVGSDFGSNTDITNQ